MHDTCVWFGTSALVYCCAEIKTEKKQIENHATDFCPSFYGAGLSIRVFELLSLYCDVHAIMRSRDRAMTSASAEQSNRRRDDLCNRDNIKTGKGCRKNVVNPDDERCNILVDSCGYHLENGYGTLKVPPWTSDGTNRDHFWSQQSPGCQ
jgi:hypothetical protein